MTVGATNTAGTVERSDDVVRRCVAMGMAKANLGSGRSLVGSGAIVGRAVGSGAAATTAVPENDAVACEPDRARENRLR